MVLIESRISLSMVNFPKSSLSSVSIFGAPAKYEMRVT